MEASDRQLIEQLASDNFQLRKLYEEHEQLEAKLSRYQNRPFLSADEELEAKRLKIQKLRGVDQMMRIISPHRAAA